MKPIKILYDIQHDEFSSHIKKKVSKISKEIERNIDLEICDGVDLISLLKKDTSYNFVMLHVGGNPNGACRQAKKCQEFYHGVLIAESNFFPYQEEFIKNYFNEYIPSLMQNPNHLKNVFQKYRFIFL